MFLFLPSLVMIPSGVGNVDYFGLREEENSMLADAVRFLAVLDVLGESGENNGNWGKAVSKTIKSEPLTCYADSYETMGRISSREGREPIVSPSSVAFDIRNNMIPAMEDYVESCVREALEQAAIIADEYVGRGIIAERIRGLKTNKGESNVK